MRGFKGLKTRVLLYQKGRNSCIAAFEELQKKIEEAKQEQETKKKTFTEIKKTQLSLSHRILKILRQFAVTQHRNTPLTPEEIDLHRRLTQLIPEQHNKHQFQDRVEETIATLPPQDLSQTTIESPDAENMKKLFRFLKEHQNNIRRLMKTLEDGKRDIQILEQIQLR